MEGCRQFTYSFSFVKFFLTGLRKRSRRDADNGNADEIERERQRQKSRRAYMGKSKKPHAHFAWQRRCDDEPPGEKCEPSEHPKPKQRAHALCSRIVFQEFLKMFGELVPHKPEYDEVPRHCAKGSEECGIKHGVYPRNLAQCHD